MDAAERAKRIIPDNGLVVDHHEGYCLREAIAAAIREAEVAAAAEERERCAALVEKRRLAVLRDATDPTRTEHFAELQNDIRALG